MSNKCIIKNNDFIAKVSAMVTYQRLWEILKKKKIRKHDLMELADISSTTLTKLNKNEIVALTVLIKICKALDCQAIDIMEFCEK